MIVCVILMVMYCYNSMAMIHSCTELLCQLVREENVDWEILERWINFGNVLLLKWNLNFGFFLRLLAGTGNILYFTALISMISMLAVWARMTETLSASLTLKWFFSSMESIVLSQMVFVLEGFLAYIAWERSLTYNKQKDGL